MLTSKSKVTMFDGLVVWLKAEDFTEPLLHNPSLRFETSLFEDSGEITRYIAELKGIKIFIYPSGLVKLKGSIHKYANHGVHNFDQFTFKRLALAIYQLSSELKFDLDKAVVHSFEFGLNLITQFNPTEYFSSLISYKGKQFNNYDVGDGKQCLLDKYIVKIYDKGKQYSCGSNILRIEVKVLKMAAVKLGIVYLKDLLNIEVWQRCMEHLLEVLDALIIFEKLNTDLSGVPKEVYIKGANPENWKKENITPNGRNKLKAKFNQVIRDYGINQYHQTVNDLTKYHFDCLIC